MAAKKAPAKTVEVAPQQEVVAQVAAQPIKPTVPSWEIKDRVYFLKGGNSPGNLNI